MFKPVLGNVYFLTFLNGFLMASLFYFKMEANYEKALFQAIRYNLNGNIISAESEDSIVVNVMHVCHKLLVSRIAFFGGRQGQGFESSVLESATTDLMTARGACSSYSMVLARALQGYNYPVRIAQMKAKASLLPTIL